MMTTYAEVRWRFNCAVIHRNNRVHDLAASEIMGARLKLRSCSSGEVALSLCERWGALGAGYRKAEPVYPDGAMCPVMVGARHVTEIVRQ